MCNSLDLFVSTHKITDIKHSITIPDGRKVMVDLYGDVILMDGIVLKNVLYVPVFQFNLISIHKLCSNLCTNVVFTNGECLIQDHSKTKVLGKLSNGLYYIYIPLTSSHNSQQKSTCVAVQPSSQPTFSIDLAKLWNLRLSYLPFSKMKFLFPDMNVNKVTDSTICRISAARQI